MGDATSQHAEAFQSLGLLNLRFQFTPFLLRQPGNNDLGSGICQVFQKVFHFRRDLLFTEECQHTDRLPLSGNQSKTGK